MKFLAEYTVHLDKYVPGGDYVVIKFARWAFEKFKDSEDKLGTQMRAVGEVMSIGKNLQGGASEGDKKSLKSDVTDLALQRTYNNKS